VNTAQIALFQLREEKKYFGGALLKNSHAKEKRPITVQAPMHLVMRSDIAKREYSLLRKERRIQQLIYDQGRKFGVKIYRLANAGNHLHLIILPRSRRAFTGFVRAISGLIARFILRAERGRARGIRFWDKRPFTRIISWGREYAMVCDYLLQNTLEALGFLPYRPRRTPRLRSG
jgi:REP element-mobilizing transposase RayT